MTSALNFSYEAGNYAGKLNKNSQYAYVPITCHY